jgi:hypothetical protein
MEPARRDNDKECDTEATTSMRNGGNDYDDR